MLMGRVDSFDAIETGQVHEGQHSPGQHRIERNTVEVEGHRCLYAPAYAEHHKKRHVSHQRDGPRNQAQQDGQKTHGPCGQPGSAGHIQAHAQPYRPLHFGCGLRGKGAFLLGRGPFGRFFQRGFGRYRRQCRAGAGRVAPNAHQYLGLRFRRPHFVQDAKKFGVFFEVRSEPPLRVRCRRLHENVWEDECVELFWADAAEPSRYLEVVVNPEGIHYTARIANPHASRETWHVVRGVPVPGLRIRVEGSPANEPATRWTSWRCGISVPWAVLTPPLGRPRPGEERRGNLTRIARGRSLRFETLAPTGRATPPDFHVPSNAGGCGP